MLIPCDEVNMNILNTFRVMIILRQLYLLTNLHMKLLSTQGTGADKFLSSQRVNTLIICKYEYECYCYIVLSVTLELHSPTILFVIISGNEPLSQLSLLAVIFRQFKTIFI